MECTQAEAFEQYIRDLRVVRSISRPSFPEGKAPAAVLEEIQTNALRCNALMRQNEALLAQFVYDRDPASLTEEDIQGLSAFAGRLFNYANSEDMGVAFKVHQLLLAAARSREDVPMIVRELYYTGITLHYMNVRDEGTGINLLGDAIQVYFTEAAEYMSRYEQLDRNTRQYLIRCVGNTRLGDVPRHPCGKLPVSGAVPPRNGHHPVCALPCAGPGVPLGKLHLFHAHGPHDPADPSAAGGGS